MILKNSLGYTNIGLVRKVEDSGSPNKFARDLAKLLDSDLLFPSDETIAEYRIHVMRRLSELLETMGAVGLEPEPETLQALIPKASERAKEMVSRFPIDYSQLALDFIFCDYSGSIDERTKNFRELQRIRNFIYRYPMILDRHVDVNVVMQALVNLYCIKIGIRQLPIQFEYGFSIKGAVDKDSPPRPAKVLIVDDMVPEIVSSFCALAGWPDLDISWILVEHPQSCTGRKAFKDGIVDSVIESEPDVVLMDQGMFISGSELITEILSRVGRNSGITFIANTGGSPDELYEAGAVGSFEKGECPDSMFLAFHNL